MAKARGGRPASRKVYVAVSLVGRGVFTNRSFEPEQKIAEIRGEVITEVGYGSTYCMDYGEGRLLEPASPFRFLNHSCEPNCELVIWVDEDSDDPPKLCLHALTAIEPQDELTIDYAWSADAAVPCQCGRPSCRGWVVSADELPLLVARETETLS